MKIDAVSFHNDHSSTVNLAKVTQKQSKNNELPNCEVNSEINRETIDKNQKITEEKVRKIVQEVNDGLEFMAIKLDYSFHKETNRAIIRMIDRKDDTIIKEFPSEESLDMLVKFREAVGLIIDYRL